MAAEDFDLDLSFESDHEDETTAAEILELMEEVWLNEKFAPELLPHKIEIVDCLYMQLNEMEKNVEQVKKNDVRRCAHELELNRIRYMLSSYLRVRLLKIETYVDSILEQEKERIRNGQTPYLTEKEMKFADTYKTIMKKYLDEVFNFIPGYVPDESKENPIQPNLDSFVFFQSKKAIDGVMLDIADNNQDDLVDIQCNSKMIMSYSSIEGLLKKGDVKLI